MKFREYLKNEEISTTTSGIVPYDVWGDKDETSQTKKKRNGIEEDEEE